MSLRMTEQDLEALRRRGMVRAEKPAPEAKAGGHAWGNARIVPTTLDGIRFRSATEARVYRRLKLELQPGQRLAVHVRLPIWCLLPSISRPKREHYYEADFVIFNPAEFCGFEVWGIIDAKPRKRDGLDLHGTGWRRTKAAVEASYGITVEEASE